MSRVKGHKAPLAVVGGAIALRLAIGIGFANYDTLYSLVWGQQLGRGQNPAYHVPLAPTPHPLLELIGLVLSPLGAAATLTVVVALAYLSLAWLGYLVYLLGARWFSWPVGLAAAAFVLSRYEVLSFGVRAYADIPYVALVLAALALETRRPRAGWPVIALLDLAGLLRPEAWLFAGVYWLYLWRWASPRERAALAVLVALPPVLWALSDLAVTGRPLWSLTNTRNTARQLQRATGILNVPYYGARRIGEVLGPDGLVVGALGGLMSLWLARSRALLGAATGVVAVVAFAILGAAGLPIQDRYVFLIAAILCVFAGAGLAGWRTLSPRRPWLATGALSAIAVLAGVAWSVPRFYRTFDGTKPADQALSAQQRIADDLVALVTHHAICTPISVPYASPQPLLALYLHTSPANILVGTRGTRTYLAPAGRAVFTEYQLDSRDPVRTGGVPAGLRLIASNRSWRIYSRC